MKHVFIVNPISGKGNAVGYIPLINDYFRRNPGDFDIIVTEQPKHAMQIASQYHKEDDVIIYSVGGDGTAKEILDGINRGTPICVVPGGTGNDFFKSIDKRKLSREQLLAELIEGENIQIDYGVFNGTSRFMNVSSFGIDATINVYANQYLKVKYKLPGSMVYGIAALAVGTHPKEFHMDLEVDGIKYERNPVLVAICNGQYYGGAFRPAPNARLDDHYFDICIINGPITVPVFFSIISKYLNGTHLSDKRVEMLHGKDIQMHFNREIDLQVDGEDTKLQDASILLIPGGVTIRVPKNRVV